MSHSLAPHRQYVADTPEGGVSAAPPRRRAVATWWHARSLRAQLWIRALTAGAAWGVLYFGTHRLVTRDPTLIAEPTLHLVLGLVAAALIAGLIDGAVRGAERSLRDAATVVRALAEGNAEPTPLEHVSSGAHSGERALHDALNRLTLTIAERQQIFESDMLQLREVEQLKTDFVSTVSHELRTPLTSMRGALGLVLGGAAGDVSAKARQLLRIASQSTDRLIRLINEILDIEKIEAGHVAMRAERCDVGDALRMTVGGLETLALEAGVPLVIRGARSAPVLGDADRLVQLFTNLLSNAIKFSPRGREVIATIVVTDVTVVVSVRDHGPGIPEEFRARIFGKFQQADGSSMRAQGGTGLGLTIARAIAELHGGTIDFESATDRGTTFSVVLPLLASVPVTDESALDAGMEVHGSRVLVVDGDRGIINMLGALCQPFAHVEGTAQPERAWELVRAGRVDAVVVDPAISGGLALVRRLLSANTYVPVLIFSTREYDSAELASIGLPSARAFVKSRDSERELALRLRAALEANGAPRQVA